MIYKDIEINDYIKNYELRNLEQNEIPKFVSLFKSVFKKNWDEKFWNWFFYKHPYETFSWALWDDEELIGHVCGQKKIVSINGKEYDCVLGSTSVVHADYRGQGLYIYLFKSMINLLAKRDFLFFYGFPNEKYNCGLYFKKFSWDFCEKKFILIKNIKSLESSGNEFKELGQLTFLKITEFPESINQINFNERNGIFIVKNSNFLNWRYIEHPINNYDCFIILDNNENIIGYFVIKTYINDKNEKFGEIDDFQIKSELNYAFSEMLKFVIKYFTQKNYNFISTWVGLNTEYYDILMKNNFYEFEMPTSWGFIILQNIHTNLKDILLNSKDWNLKMGDSDVF